MSSIRFIMPSVRSEGIGLDNSGLSVPVGSVDPYNQLPHPVEMIKKAGAVGRRLARSIFRSRPRTVAANPQPAPYSLTRR
jgi:hypothetical protein